MKIAHRPIGPEHPPLVVAEIGINHGVYDNPMDLTDQSWTVMRFSEVEVEAGRSVGHF